MMCKNVYIQSELQSLGGTGHVSRVLGSGMFAQRRLDLYIGSVDVGCVGRLVCVKSQEESVGFIVLSETDIVVASVLECVTLTDSVEKLAVSVIGRNACVDMCGELYGMILGITLGPTFVYGFKCCSRCWVGFGVCRRLNRGRVRSVISGRPPDLVWCI